MQHSEMKANPPGHDANSRAAPRDEAKSIAGRHRLNVFLARIFQQHQRIALNNFQDAADGMYCLTGCNES